ncbi:hypothetical protein ACJIZ3_003218 [Penstemon smallii]|uniref:Uncharacterized protein n=1 Tax=Penstemon smallii TaxID=265156 RepID=A0ABD3UBN9_9LAMI
MSVFIRRNLIYLLSKNSSFAYKSQSYVSLHFFSTFDEKENQPVISPTVSDLLLKKHKFSPQAASKIASVLTQIKDPEKSDSILLFLKESGFSNTQLEKIVICRPRLLSASLENSIKPKIKIFQDLGFSAHDIALIVTRVPSILHRSANNSLIPALKKLTGLLGCNAEVARLLKHCGWFLTDDLEKTMVPNIEFLKSCGISMDSIFSFIYNYPRCILVKPEILRKCVEKAHEMGVNRDYKSYIYAIGIIASRSDEAWELKLQAFRNVGFSESDIKTLFRKAPIVFAVSGEKIKAIKEVLLATGKYDLSCIVTSPKSLTVSIEKRYKPRLQVLSILEKKNLIKEWPSLGRVFYLTDVFFLKNYVAPYLNEIGGERERAINVKDLIKELGFQ